MAPSSSTEAQMKSEIARLTGQQCVLFMDMISHLLKTLQATINQHKSRHLNPSTTEIPPHRNNATRNTYINPSYKPANKYIRPGLSIAPQKVTAPQTIAKPLSTGPLPTAPTEVKEVVLGGVAFESSGRSLVRKDRESLLLSNERQMYTHDPFPSTETKTNFECTTKNRRIFTPLSTLCA